MKVSKWDDRQDQAISEQIKKVLFACDHEFNPPLSSRNSSTQSDLAGVEQANLSGPESYFEKMIKQDFILAEMDGELLGFLSFIDGYQDEAYQKRIGTDNNKYVTTICVAHAHRGNGIANKLYDQLEKVTRQEGNRYLSTRTWTGNDSHLRIMKQRGFKNILTLENHRGQGVDTFYFLKELIS